MPYLPLCLEIQGQIRICLCRASCFVTEKERQVLSSEDVVSVQQAVLHVMTRRFILSLSLSLIFRFEDFKDSHVTR